MLAYLGSIWQCRFFWLSLVMMDLRTRYRRSFLGMGWSLLHPILMTIILYTVFRNITMDPQNADIFAPYLLAGLATWGFITTGAVAGCNCLFQGGSYIRQHPAPIAIYPLRTALGGVIHFGIALVVVIAMAWWIIGFGNLAALWCLLPNVVLLFLFVWALAVLMGFANVYFQDTQHLCEVAFQGLMYVTPIIWDAEMVRKRGMGWLVDCNPLAAMVDLVRDPVLHGRLPSLATYQMALLTVLLTGAAAVLTLRRCQRLLVFHL
jgi:ABC-type polysaccharide/polyol phosphate export permease